MLPNVASNQKISRHRVGIVIVVLLLTLILFSSHTYYNVTPITHTLNATLGFGATILISLPERTDRRDAVTLISSTSGIEITHIVDAVHGDGVTVKAKPFGFAAGKLDDPHWGSWRSHLNALRYIVDNRIETALIVEDDVDWEPSIKLQLSHFAKSLKSFTLGPDGPAGPAASHPYGTDWDILHLGISNVTIPPEPFDRVSIEYHDETLTPGPYRDTDCEGKGKPWYCFSPYLSRLELPEQSRAIIPSYRPVGLVAIAVSFTGAQRLLYLLSWKGLDEGLDWSIRDQLATGQLSGWTILPPLFGSWTTSKSDSDIRHTGAYKAADNLKGRARGIGESARQQLGNLIENRKGWQSFGDSRHG